MTSSRNARAVRRVGLSLVVVGLLTGCGPEPQQGTSPQGAPTWEGYVNNTPIPTPGVGGLGTASPATSPSAIPMVAATPRVAPTQPPAAPAAPTPRITQVPPTTQAAPAAPRVGTLEGRTIVLDPGHNGGASTAFNNKLVPAGNGRRKACNTSGTATSNGVPEHTINWRLAQALKATLQDAGARVVLTRTSDDGAGPCVNQRAAVGNDERADAAVSLHADGSDAAGARGFHVIRSTTMTGGARVQAESTALADAVVAQFDAIMPRSNYLGGGTATTPRDDIAGLNLSRVPAVMLEAGNLRNATDAAKLTDPAFVQTQAAAIRRALEAYFAGR